MHRSPSHNRYHDDKRQREDAIKKDTYEDCTAAIYTPTGKLVNGQHDTHATHQGWEKEKGDDH